MHGARNHAQGATRRLQTFFHQAFGQQSILRNHRLLHIGACTLRLRTFLAPQRAAGMHITRRYPPRQGGIVRLGDKEAVPTIQHQRLARQGLQPVSIGNAPGKNGVEQLAACCGKQHSLLGAGRRFAAGKPGAHGVQIAAFMPKTLLGEPVRHTDTGDLRQTLIQAAPIALHSAHGQQKSVGTMRSAPQFARVARHHHNLRRRSLRKLRPIHRMTRRRQTEPLRGHCMAILQPGIADIALGATSQPRQLLRHPGSVFATLAHRQPQVLAAPLRGKTEDFVHHKIFGDGAQLPA